MPLSRVRTDSLSRQDQKRGPLIEIFDDFCKLVIDSLIDISDRGREFSGGRKWQPTLTVGVKAPKIMTRRMCFAKNRHKEIPRAIGDQPSDNLPLQADPGEKLGTDPL